MSARRGVWIFVLLLMVIGTAVLFAAFHMRQPSSGSGSSTVLVMDVPTEIEEGEVPFRPSPFRFARRTHTLYNVVTAIDHAAHDEGVAAIVLHIDRLDWGWAQLAELRDALARFRAGGKSVYASFEGGEEPEYFLATAADLIAMPPTVVLQLDGLTASAMFLRGTYDKLDIRPNFAHAGRYKSAVEQYTRTGMSDDARAALENVLDDHYRVLVDSLAAGLGAEPESIQVAIDEGPYGANLALARGLVDTLMYERDLDSLAVRWGGHRFTTTTFSRYLERVSPPAGTNHIALVTAEGEIVEGKSRYGGFGDGLLLGSQTLIDALRQARMRRSIKAVVLRVDSPGGSVQASDDIWREVERCGRVKPVVVSMSDLAASGGYYIATPAKSIVADPTTITGSIGVFGGKLNILGLYHKLGLNIETVSRGKHAGMMSPFRDFTDEEARAYQAGLEDTYHLFLSRVSHGRHMSIAAVDSIAQGRIWSGIAAERIGLVDTLGGLETAIAVARREAGIGEGDVTIERFPKMERTFIERAVEQWFDTDEDDESSRAKIGAPVKMPDILAQWAEAAAYPAGAVMALMPYTIKIR